MSEITKLYENVGVKKLLYCDICKAQEHALGLCAETKCEPFYPPFTAEKQIDIIIFLINRKQPLLFSLDEGQGKMSRRIFEEGLTGIVNRIWQNLTEEEKQQVKGILE